MILLSDVDGLYSGPPSDPGSRLLRTHFVINNNNNDNDGYTNEGAGHSIQFWNKKSSVGRGGMQSKVRNMRRLQCTCQEIE